MANPVGTSSFTDWIYLQNFQVEMIDEHGRCIQGTVVDRLDDDHLLVDFHCANNSLRKLKNRGLFLAVSSDCLYQSLGDFTRKLIHVGTHVHVLVQPTSRRCPLAWYPGTVVYGSRDAPLRPNQYHDWVLVDVALTPDCHRVMFFTTRNSYVHIVPNFEVQQTSRQNVRQIDFVRYSLWIPTWVTSLQSRLANPALFMSWLSDATNSKILNLSDSRVTLLRKQHEPKVASGEFWSEFRDFAKDSADYDKQVLEWYLDRESQPVPNVPEQRMSSNGVPVRLDKTVQWMKKRYRKLLGRPPTAMSSQGLALAAKSENVEYKESLLSEMPNELLVQIFGLLDVDEQNTLTGVCSDWKDLINFCRVRKVIISTPPCHDVNSSDGCRETCGLRRLSGSISRYVAETITTLIIKASCWELCVHSKRRGVTYGSPLFPFHDFLRFLKFFNIKVPVVVLCDTWLPVSPATKNSDDFTTMADITGELVLRNVKISSSVPFASAGKREILSDSTNASIRFGPKTETADRLAHFFDEVWENLPGDQKQALEKAFYEHGEWTDSQRSTVRQHLALHDRETLRTLWREVGSKMDSTNVDASKLKNHTLITLLHLLDEHPAAETHE